MGRCYLHEHLLKKRSPHQCIPTRRHVTEHPRGEVEGKLHVDEDGEDKGVENLCQKDAEGHADLQVHLRVVTLKL